MGGGCPSVMELGDYKFPDLKHLTPGMGGSILLANTYIVSIWSLWARSPCFTYIIVPIFQVRS